MSFRKRSVPLSSNIPGTSTPSAPTSSDEPDAPATNLRSRPGIRASAKFPYVLTTSTGTPSLDELLGLGAGLALGSVLAIEEDGSTDYAGILLSCFASQGILNSQEVFVGAPEGAWPLRGSLPGLVKSKEKTKKEGEVGDRMKIAWRYERLGVMGEKDRGK